MIKDKKILLDEKKVNEVIKTLDKEFDTHKFIEKFYSKYEKEYVKLLSSHIDSDGIFRATHSEIGKFLASNASYLKIQKIDRGESENIKKYNSRNQNWKKI